jgi:hypothetical protein
VDPVLPPAGKEAFYADIWDHEITEEVDGKAFVRYKVKHSYWRVKSSSSDFVWRRFSDFVVLRDAVSRKIPGAPSLGWKAFSLLADQLSAAFIEQRWQTLMCFLQWLPTVMMGDKCDTEVKEALQFFFRLDEETGNKIEGGPSVVDTGGAVQLAGKVATNATPSSTDNVASQQPALARQQQQRQQQPRQQQQKKKKQKQQIAPSKIPKNHAADLAVENDASKGGTEGSKVNAYLARLLGGSTSPANGDEPTSLSSTSQIHISELSAIKMRVEEQLRQCSPSPEDLSHKQDSGADCSHNDSGTDCQTDSAQNSTMPTLDREEQEAEEPPREDETKPERERAHVTSDVTQGQDEGRQEDEIVEGKEGSATSVADEDEALGAGTPLDIPVPSLPPSSSPPPPALPKSASSQYLQMLVSRNSSSAQTTDAPRSASERSTTKLLVEQMRKAREDQEVEDRRLADKEMSIARKRREEADGIIAAEKARRMARMVKDAEAIKVR